MNTDVGVGEVVGRLQAQLEKAIASAIRRKCLQLDQQRRHQVERDADIGKLPQQRHHPVVVLQGVQPDPGQDVLVRHQVLVERLVHVPQDRDSGHRC